MSKNESILQKATTTQQSAEVFSIASERHYVSFESNRAKNIGQSQSSGIALRVINNEGKIGFSSTTDQTKSDDLVERAAALAHYGAEAKFQFPQPEAYPEVQCLDPQIQNITNEQMINVGESIISQVIDEFPDSLCTIDISRTIHQQRLINSNGVDVQYQQSGYGISISVELIRGTDMLSIWDGHYSAEKFEDDITDALLKRTLHRMRLSQKIVDAPAGNDIPVLFTPTGFVATMLPPLLSGFSGKNVATGSSPLINKWGEKMVDDAITIYDNPLQPMAAQSHPVDDEGIPARRVSIIDQGKIGEPILDLQTAGEIGRESTGSGMRALSTTPTPSTSFIAMEAGTTNPEAMCQDVQQGIIVELLLGAGQGNELGGEFRANVSLGFLIENGEPVGRIKDTMISGNAYNALNNIEAISSEPQHVYGTRLVPAVRCRGVEIATSST